MTIDDSYRHWREFSGACAFLREDVSWPSGALMQNQRWQFTIIGTWNVSDRRRPHHANTNTFPHHRP